MSKNYAALEISKRLRSLKSIYEFCPNHNLEPMKFICEDCNVSLCSSCLLPHSGHNINGLSCSNNVIEKNLDTIQSLVNKEKKIFELRLDMLESSMKSLEIRKDKLSE